MADRRRFDQAVVIENAAKIEGLLRARIGEVSRSIQQTPAAEISELRGDPQLVELLGASVEGNIDTVFHRARSVVGEPQQPARRARP